MVKMYENVTFSKVAGDLQLGDKKVTAWITWYKISSWRFQPHLKNILVKLHLPTSCFSSGQPYSLPSTCAWWFWRQLHHHQWVFGTMWYVGLVFPPEILQKLVIWRPHLHTNSIQGKEECLKGPKLFTAKGTDTLTPPQPWYRQCR